MKRKTILAILLVIAIATFGKKKTEAFTEEKYGKKIQEPP